MSEPLWIKSGRIVDPANNRDEQADLFVADGVIREELSKGERSSARVIDADGLVVAPGFVDLRAHLREPGGGGRETIASGSRAAAAGGFTTVVCMPDVSPTADNAGTIRYLQDAIAKSACVNVLVAGCLTLEREGKYLSPIGSLVKAGVVAITDSPSCPQNNEIFRRTLEYAGMFDLPIFDLPFDADLVADAVAHEGSVSLRLGLRGWPRAAEELYVTRAVTLATATGTPVHLQSISSSGSVEILRRAKNRGAPVTADVTPHHLALTDEFLSGYDPNYKARPPLRTEEDRQALIAGLLDGALDCVATAHEPCLQHEKDVEFDLAPFGVVGLETALPVCLETLVRPEHCGLSELMSMFSARPSSVLGLDKGTLSVGATADLAIFDPDRTWSVSPENLKSLSANSPWLGAELRGHVTHAVVGGQVVHELA